MPVRDFSTQMAEMITRARPPQAPPPGRPVVMQGRGLGSLGGEVIETQMGIDLDPWMRLFGYKSDEEIDKLYQQFVAEKERNPTAWGEAKNSEPIQKTLKAIRKRGRGPIILDTSGLLDIPETTPEAMVREKKPTGEQILSGAYGSKAKEELSGEMEKARPFDEPKFLATAPSKDLNIYMLNKAKLAQATAEASETKAGKKVLEAQANSYNAAAKAHEASAKFDTEKLRLLPEEQARLDRESKANINMLNVRARRDRVEADAVWEGIKASRVENKRENILLKSTVDTYRISQQAWIRAYGKVIGKPTRQMVDLLTGITDSHLSAVKNLGRSKLGNESLSFWLSMANQEFHSALEATTGELPTRGRLFLPKKWEAVSPEADILFRQRAIQGTDFVTTMGNSISRGNLFKALDLFTRIYSKITPTSRLNKVAHQVIRIGKQVGFDTSGLEALVPRRTKGATKGVTKGF